MRENHRRKISLIAVIIALILAMPQTAAASVKVYTQGGNALAGYHAGSFSVVHNSDMEVSGYGYRHTSSQVLSATRGTSLTFRSHLYLSSAGIHNPQSIAVTPDGKYAYVMTARKYSAKKECNWKGRVYRIDLSAYEKQKDASSVSSKYVKTGPEFTTGHGQAMAYNPVTKELWYIQNAKMKNANLVRIDTKSLKPDKEIRFKLKSSVKIGNNLAFDNDGNVYFYTRSNGGWAPKGTIKIYQGQIGSKSVHFRLIMQGIRNGAGAISQSLGYNPLRNRLYFISDGGIISVPVSKLGALSPTDCETSVFGGQSREFEGLSYTKTGLGYFITNRPYEIMWDTSGRDEYLKKEAEKKARNLARKRAVDLENDVREGLLEMSFELGDSERDAWERTGDGINKEIEIAMDPEAALETKKDKKKKDSEKSDSKDSDSKDTDKSDSKDTDKSDSKDSEKKT